ncbi:MAG: aldehyde dehydrogenase family protein, partial [Acidimicrobiia bacterium]
MAERWTFGSYVDGEWTAGDADGELEVVNPATEEVIGTVPHASVGDVQRAITAARRAFDDGPWPWMAVPERAAAVKRLADALDARRKELADLL